MWQKVESVAEEVTMQIIITYFWDIFCVQFPFLVHYDDELSSLLSQGYEVNGLSVVRVGSVSVLGRLDHSVQCFKVFGYQALFSLINNILNWFTYNLSHVQTHFDTSQQTTLNLNTLTIGDIAHDEQFLLLSQCFHLFSIM